MINKKFLSVLLWLLVIFSGIAAGAGIYEARVMFPLWLTATGDTLTWNASVAASSDPGLKFWAFVTTGPLTLLTLIIIFLVWRTRGELRKWLLLTVVLLLIDRLMTFTYFIPTMVGLMSDSLDPAKAAEIAKQRGDMNIVRLTIAGLAFLAALKTFAVHYSVSSRK